jgi:hypothetical protein
LNFFYIYTILKILTAPTTGNLVAMMGTGNSALLNSIPLNVLRNTLFATGSTFNITSLAPASVPLSLVRT